MNKCMEKRWITNGTNRPFYARKVFHMNAKLKEANIAICGLGQFQLFINGKKVGDHVLDPAWTNYRKIINYVTFDVSDYLTVGENVIAVEIGNGWFIMDNEHYSFHFPPFMPENPNPYKPFSSELMMILELNISSDNRTKQTIVSDESWKVKEHMVIHSNVYGSETIDGRKRVADWKEVDCNDANWQNACYVEESKIPNGKLIKQEIPAIKVIKEYRAQYLYKKENAHIFDFSQNMSGLLSFDIKGKRGQEIHILPAEKLDQEGKIDQMAKNWMMIDSCITYIIGEDDVWEHVEMMFTYFAGRFIAIDGCELEQLRDVKAQAISSAWEQSGKFWCDDERYLKVYDLVEKSVESNMLSIHTDCPTIERFAWQEENHLMAPSIMYMKQVKKHWKKFLDDARYDQITKDDKFKDMAGNIFCPGEGLIPSQSPCYIPNVLPVPGMGSFYDIIAWGSSIILGTYWHYMFYGDKEIVGENYEAGKKYFEHQLTMVDANGFISHGLGDWGNPIPEALARENVETAFLYADAIVLEKFATLLNKDDDASYFAKKALEIKNNYNKKLLIKNDKTGLYCYRTWDHKDEIYLTQASQALPLYWGMVPDEYIEDVVKTLRNILEEAGSFVTGEVGQPYLIQTMNKYGMQDLICSYIMKEEHPSYYAFVLDGETTLGEYWEENPRSHCHDMMGHIIEWFYNGIAGIQIIEPGFKKIKWNPFLPKTMNEVKCSYECPYGTIEISLRRTSDGIERSIVAPEEVVVEVDD